MGATDFVEKQPKLDIRLISPQEEEKERLSLHFCVCVALHGKPGGTAGQELQVFVSTADRECVRRGVAGWVRGARKPHSGVRWRPRFRSEAR